MKSFKINWVSLERILLSKNRKEIDLILDDHMFIVSLDLKSRKNINIRIKENNVIRVSKPWTVSEKKLMSFLMERKEWILKQSSALNHVMAKRHAHIEDDRIILFGEEVERSESFDLNQILLDYILSRRSEYDVLLNKTPKISVRSMKGKWGYCVPSKNHLVFNVNLVHYPKEVIDYVILHEYTHLKIANHSKAFYDFIEEVMPDYKKRITYLKEH